MRITFAVLVLALVALSANAEVQEVQAEAWGRRRRRRRRRYIDPLEIASKAAAESTAKVEKAGKTAAERTGKAAEKTGKAAAEKSSKVEAGAKAAERTGKAAAEEAAKAAAEKAAKAAAEVISKEKATKAAVEKAVKATAEKATKEAAEKLKEKTAKAEVKAKAEFKAKAAAAEEKKAKSEKAAKTLEEKADKAAAKLEKSTKEATEKLKEKTAKTAAKAAEISAKAKAEMKVKADAAAAALAKRRCHAGNFYTAPLSCKPCTAGRFTAKDGQTSCAAFRTCPTGQFVLAMPTRSSDRACRTCAHGTFTTKPNSAKCSAWQKCTVKGMGADPKNYQGTSSSDRICSPCVLHKTYSEDHLYGGFVCGGLTQCDANEWEAVLPTTYKDRQCADHSKACPAGQYTTAGPVAANHKTGERGRDRRCRQITKCLEGEYEFTKPTKSSDRFCKACPDGTFKAVPGNAACTKWRTCPAGSGLDEEGDAAQDRKCKACEVGKAFSDNSDGKPCKPVRKPCPAGEYIRADATAASDMTCDACAAGKFTASAGRSSCRTWRRCYEGTGLKLEGTHTQDRKCEACEVGKTFSDAKDGAKCRTVRVCGALEYETVPATATSDRACATHTICAAGLREHAAPTPHADRVCVACGAGTFKAAPGNAASCAPWRTCAVGAGLRVEGSATADRQCAPCALGATFSPAADGAACKAVRSPCPAGEHVFAAATASSDLECAHCAPGHYTPAAGHGECIQCDGFTEWQPASRSVGCRTVTTCLSTEYEVSPPTHLVDRVCAPITLCAPGKYETKAPDASSDRVCTNCAPGRAQHLPEAKWCPQCDRGRYQGRAGATDCADCAPGTAGGATGLTACPQCAAGRFADAPKQIACKGCAADTFAASAGAASCAACDYHCDAGLVKHSCGAADAGTCVPCEGHEFKAKPGAHGCQPHVNPDCLAGHRESTAPSTTSDRVCTICGEHEHKPLAGNGACTACPLGYKAHTDRLSCFAYKCSHVRCKYEEHTCRWGRPDKDLRAWVGLAFHAEPGTTCEDGARYTSVRVNHGVNARCGRHCRCDQPWNCRDLPSEEQVCHAGHHCGLGLVSGDKASCECMPLAAPADFPTNKPSAFCAECAAFSACPVEDEPKTALRSHTMEPDAKFLPLEHCHGDCDHDAHCKAGYVCHQQDEKSPIPGCEGEPDEAMDYCIRASDAAVASRRLAATATNGKPCSARPQHCSLCETAAQRDARKAAAAADDVAAKARHDKIELKLACFDKAEAACHASRADCVWDPDAGCFASFSAAERAEADAWTRRIEAKAAAREAKANALTAAASERNTKAHAAAAEQRGREAVLCPSRRTESSCNVIHKCGWDSAEAKCLVVADAVKRANERAAKAHAAESTAKAREAGEKEKWNKAEERKAKVQAEKDAKLAAKREAERLAELKAKHDAEVAMKREAAAKRAAELKAKHVAELKAKAVKAAEQKAKEAKLKEQVEKKIAAAEAAKKAEAEKTGKAAAEALTKEVAEVAAKDAAEKKTKFDAQEKAKAEEKASKASARCHCPNGVATTGLACPKHGDPGCSACKPTFHLANGGRQCDPNLCSCIHGQVATAGDCTHHGSTHCTACHPGYRMEGKDCVLAPTPKSVDCQAVRDSGKAVSGTYTICPSAGNCFDAYCLFEGSSGYTLVATRGGQEKSGDPRPHVQSSVLVPASRSGGALSKFRFAPLLASATKFKFNTNGGDGYGPISLLTGGNNCRDLGTDLTRCNLVHNEKSECAYRGADYSSIMGVARENNRHIAYPEDCNYFAGDGTKKLWTSGTLTFGGFYASFADLYVGRG